MRTQKVLELVNKKVNNYGKLLFLTKSGSHLYGTNTPDSDEDYLGVFLAKPEYHLGFKSLNEVDCSIRDKDESGKNTKDAIDIKVYELKQFLKLAGNNNPNILELLFATDNSVIYNTTEFKKFQNNYKLFVSQRVRHTFLGYAKQQFKKGVQKPDNFKNLKETLDILRNYSENEFLAVIVEKDPFLRKFDKGKFIQIGNLSFQKNLYVKKVIKQIEEKIKMASHRAYMWEQFGYDAKFFMHLFRLLDEAKDLLTTGKINFPLKNRDYLLTIRSGILELEELQNLAQEKFNEINSIPSNLPEKANWDEIEKIFLNILKQKICSK